MTSPGTRHAGDPPDHARRDAGAGSRSPSSSVTRPWPPMSGGDLRNVVDRAIDRRRRLFARHPLPPATRTGPECFAARNADAPHVDACHRRERILRRVAGTIRGRHPFLERLEATGGVDRLTRDLDELGARVVVLTYPFLGRVPRSVRRPGRRVIVDLDTSRELTDRRRLQTSTSPTQRLQAMLDVAIARRMEVDACRSADEMGRERRRCHGPAQAPSGRLGSRGPEHHRCSGATASTEAPSDWPTDWCSWGRSTTDRMPTPPAGWHASSAESCGEAPQVRS